MRLLLILLLSLPLWAQSPLRILFIGNSYTYVNDLPGTLTRLAAAAQPPVKLETQSVVVGGATLRMHVASGAAARTIASSHWDYVVLQEQSHLGVERLSDTEPFHSAARELNALIKKAGAKTVFYLTWSYKPVPQDQALLNDAYYSIAKELGAIVVPAGPAWLQVRQERPALELYAADGSHPSPTGTYLAACVFYAVLLGRSPVGLPGTVTDAAYLQSVAWKAAGRR